MPKGICAVKNYKSCAISLWGGAVCTRLFGRETGRIYSRVERRGGGKLAGKVADARHMVDAQATDPAGANGSITAT